MNSSQYNIALCLVQHLIKQNPCELSQKQILEELEKTFELKLSRSALTYNMVGLKQDGYIESRVKGNPRVTVYAMTDKLLSFFEREYQRYSELEQMMLNMKETESDIQIKKNYLPLQRPAAPGFYGIASPGEKLDIVEVSSDSGADNKLHILLPGDDHKYPIDLRPEAEWFGPLADLDLTSLNIPDHAAPVE